MRDTLTTRINETTTAAADRYGQTSGRVLDAVADANRSVVDFAVKTADQVIEQFPPRAELPFAEQMPTLPTPAEVGDQYLRVLDQMVEANRDLNERIVRMLSGDHVASVQDLADNVTKSVKDVSDQANKTVKDISDQANKTVKPVADNVVKTVKDVSDQANKTVKDVTDEVSSRLGGVTGSTASEPMKAPAAKKTPAKRTAKKAAPKKATAKKAAPKKATVKKATSSSAGG